MQSKSSGISLSRQLELRLRYHPLRVMTLLMLGAVTSVFLFLTSAYLQTTYGRGFHHFALPAIFHANTILILMSSYSMHQTRKAMLDNDHAAYRSGLWVTCGLGLAFTLFQIFGWRDLLANRITLTNNIAGAYLYVISGLHLLHLLVGVALLAFFLYRSYANDEVQSLLFDTDPFVQLRVRMLTLYWHFVDGLWIYLYLFFLLNIYVLR